MKRRQCRHEALACRSREAKYTCFSDTNSVFHGTKSRFIFHAPQGALHGKRHLPNQRPQLKEIVVLLAKGFASQHSLSFVSLRPPFLCHRQRSGWAWLTPHAAVNRRIILFERSKKEKARQDTVVSCLALAPPVGLEPTTLRLTAACSTD